jgi:hypothetical protein
VRRCGLCSQASILNAVMGKHVTMYRLLVESAFVGCIGCAHLIIPTLLIDQQSLEMINVPELFMESRNS